MRAAETEVDTILEAVKKGLEAKAEVLFDTRTPATHLRIKVTYTGDKIEFKTPDL